MSLRKTLRSPGQRERNLPRLAGQPQITVVNYRFCVLTEQRREFMHSPE
jgi:hypothetical protein